MAVKINRIKQKDIKVTVNLSPEQFCRMAAYCHDKLNDKAHSAFYRDLGIAFLDEQEAKERAREERLSALAKALNTANQDEILRQLLDIVQKDVK